METRNLAAVEELEDIRFPYLFQDLKVYSTVQTHYILFFLFTIVKH